MLGARFCRTVPTRITVVEGKCSQPRSALGLLPRPTKPRPAGVWSLLSLPEAGKPAAGWRRAGEGGDAVKHWRCLKQRPPPPTPPHKGEGSAPSLRHEHQLEPQAS